VAGRHVADRLTRPEVVVRWHRRPRVGSSWRAEARSLPRPRPGATEMSRRGTMVRSDRPPPESSCDSRPTGAWPERRGRGAASSASTAGR
jgi:hypothetical protein